MFVFFFHSIWMLWKVSFYSVNGVLRTWLDPRFITIIQWAGRRWSKEKEPSEHFKSKQQQKWDENVGSTCSILLPSNKKILYFQFILKIPISNNSLSWLLTQSLSATKTISHYRHWFYIQYTCGMLFFFLSIVICLNDMHHHHVAPPCGTPFRQIVQLDTREGVFVARHGPPSALACFIQRGSIIR